jgi:heme/copper-type cytochrome/quinol oxidase subunit 1
MALTETPPDAEAAAPAPPASPAATRSQPTAFERMVGAGDHVILGRVLVVLSLVMLVASLVISILADADAASEGSILQAAAAERLLLNQQVSLLLCGVLPLLLGVALIVVPAQIGSPTVAFPRAASFGVWTWLLSTVLLVVAVAADGSYGGAGEKMSKLGNVATGGLIVSVVLISVCVAVTVLSFRPLGMTLRDIPFFSFAMLAAGSVWALTLASSLAHVAMAQASQANPTTLAVTTFPLGLGWLSSQPANFMVVVPLLGLLADVVATLSGGRQRFRGVVRFLIGLAAISSFGAWTQVPAARNTVLWVMVGISLVVPVLGVLGAAADTLRAGRPRLASPLGFVTLGALAALAGCLVGAVQGINTAGRGTLFAVDDLAISLGQTRLFLGAAVLAGLGGCWYWANRVAGAPLAETAGKAVAPLALVGALLWGGGIGLVGFTAGDAVGPLYGVSVAGGALLLLAAAVGLAAVVGGLQQSRRGDQLLADPWGGGGTLEWAPEDHQVGTVTDPYPLLAEPGGDD